VADYLSHRNVAFWIKNTTRARAYRIGHWEHVKCGLVDHQIGQFSLTVPLDVAWLDEVANDADAFNPYNAWYHWSIDAYIRNDTTPAWSGPLMSRRLIHDGTPDSARIQFTGETWLNNILRRGINLSATNSDASYSTYSDDIILTAVRNAWGPSPVTPTNYPETRGSAGPYWTYQGQANQGNGNSITVNEQSRNNLRGFCFHVAAKDGLYLYTVENPAGTHEVRVATTYENNDYSRRVLLTPRKGAVKALDVVESYEEVVNILAVFGSGSGSPQTVAWDSDPSSVSSIGNFEGTATLQNGTYSASATEAAALLDEQGAAQEFVTLSLTDTVAAQFNSASGVRYSQRDKVSWGCEIFGVSGTGVVRSWDLEQSGDRPFDLSVAVGDVTMRRGFARHNEEFVGVPGGLFHNSRFRGADG